jgi:hypothetical protein
VNRFANDAQTIGLEAIAQRGSVKKFGVTCVKLHERPGGFGSPEQKHLHPRRGLLKMAA